MNHQQTITDTILKKFSGVQAIYIFGSWATKDEWPDSDVDIAVLLSPEKAKKAGQLAFFDVRCALEEILGKKVDLINIRLVPTAIQKEIILNARRIYCADEYGAEEFEMLVYSLYQKLNEERGDILKEAFKSGKLLEI